MTLEEQVITIITKELRLQDGLVKPESNLVEDFGIDSLDGLEIIVAMEDHFNLALPTKTHEHIKTVQDVIDEVRKHVKSGI